MTCTDEQLEAVQHAVERVGANWDGATTETIEHELSDALRAAEAAVDDADVHRLASAIEANHGTVTVSEVLNA